MDEEMEGRYFPLIATIFVFILVTNLIGYIPLPVDPRETFNVFGVAHPIAADLRGRHQRRLPADPRVGVFMPSTRGDQPPRALSAMSKA